MSAACPSNTALGSMGRAAGAPTSRVFEGAALDQRAGHRPFATDLALRHAPWLSSQLTSTISGTQANVVLLPGQAQCGDVVRQPLGLCALLMRRGRFIRSAIVFKPSTLLRLHRALIQRKYRRLFSSTERMKPGPKGPSRDVIAAVVDMKQRNPMWGCPRSRNRSPWPSAFASIGM